jgi:hypothetical protein
MYQSAMNRFAPRNFGPYSVSALALETYQRAPRRFKNSTVKCLFLNSCVAQDCSCLPPLGVEYEPLDLSNTCRNTIAILYQFGKAKEGNFTLN